MGLDCGEIGRFFLLCDVGVLQGWNGIRRLMECSRPLRCEFCVRATLWCSVLIAGWIFQADLVTGDLFGMLHNASGHYLLRFDMFGNVEPGAARDMSAESTHGAEPEEEGDAEIVLGLSSYAPSTSRGMVPTYHRFRYTSTQNENGSRTDQIEFTTQNVVYTDFDGEVSPYDRKDEHLVSEVASRLLSCTVRAMPGTDMAYAATRRASRSRLLRSAILASPSWFHLLNLPTRPTHRSRC
eukprot:2402393-Rhodomonas_salina.6